MNKKQRLINFLMSLDVENNWLQNQYIDWESGKRMPDGYENKNDSYHTHCSSFVKAVCYKLNISMIGPPYIQTEGLANKQCIWLAQFGHLFGWQEILYNEIFDHSKMGNLIVVCYYNNDEDACGHVAIIMPTHACNDNIYICHAGLENYSCKEINYVFGELLSECKYYSHNIDFVE